MVFLAYREDEAVGLAICFRGFSTFAARPLINIHDLFVMPAHRGTGLGWRILSAIERRARRLGLLQTDARSSRKQPRAQNLYAAAGFAQATHVPEAGGALFLSKPLEFRSRLLL